MAALSIVRPGMLTTVQDLGRWGFQSSGVPVSGALDWYSHRLANRLLGNDAGAATLEVTMTGPQIRSDQDTAIAVTGAEFRLTLDEVSVAMNDPVEMRAGSVLKFGERLSGARAYIAIAGGVDVPEVLGSRSTHVLTAMGGYHGRALKAGDVVRIGKTVPGTFFSAAVEKGSRNRFPQGKLRVIVADQRLGEHLTSERFRVSSRSDRMGYRLEGGKINLAPTGELISTSVPTGAIQVPPTGEPILLMNDHATTGGYSIGAVVIGADLPLAGQLAPGDWVEFEACSLEAADGALHRREATLGGS